MSGGEHMKEVARWQRGVMSPGEATAWWLVIISTGFLAYPFYHLRKRKIASRFSLYEA